MRGNVAKTTYDGAVVALVDARAEVARVLSAMGARLYATLEAVLANGMSARALAAKRGEDYKLTGSALSFDGTRPPIRSAAPRLGTGTADALASVRR